jgi:hypothetical protein
MTLFYYKSVGKDSMILPIKGDNRFSNKKTAYEGSFLFLIQSNMKAITSSSMANPIPTMLYVPQIREIIANKNISAIATFSRRLLN